VQPNLTPSIAAVSQRTAADPTVVALDPVIRDVMPALG